MSSADAAPLPLSGNEALERFLASAAARGESIVSSTRFVLCLLALLRLLVLVPDRLLDGDPKYWISTAGLVLGASSSLPWLLRSRRSQASAARLHGSVLLDTAVLSTVLLPMVVWPHDGYLGLLREFSAAGFLLVVVAAGARLTPSVALLGITANAAALAGLLALDAALWSERLTYPPGDVALAAILFLGAGVFSWGAAKGTRLLVYRGADAYALAARATQRLGIYVSPEVAQEAVNADELVLGGTRREVAVLFSDLRGFTAYSEPLDPERLVTELNAYFEAMGAVIGAEAGQIDKFVGDAIMAVFRGERAASAGIRAAAGMQQALERHNYERAARQLPPLRQGVGVHLGSVVSGNIGAPQHLQHTVIGDTVNVASRLESATKEYGVPALISAECVERARAEGVELPELEHLGRLSVRGRASEMEVYALREPAPPA